jgi:uncharacterized protein (TIGR00661 family)
MVKIWYSVFGEGLGHAMRSAPVIQHLLKKHNVIITAGDKAYPYLSQKFGNRVIKINSAHFVVENNEVSIHKTLLNFLNKFPNDLKVNFFSIFNQIKKFRPDIVISDFEPASHYFASILKLPIISLDNIHAITKCEIKFDKKFLPLFYASQMLISSLQLESDYYLINTIKDFPVKQKNVLLYKPILRKEIINSKSENKNYILVYQTSSTNKSLINILKNVNAKFIFYGMNKSEKDKNIIFKEFSEKGFIEDFRKCMAVILNGGFTGLSEALYLKKPMLIVPVKNQFEQIFNGETVKEMKIGDWYEELDKKKINNFIKKIPYFKKNLSEVPKWDNSEILKKIEELVETLHKKNFILETYSKIIERFRIKKYERTLTIIKPDAVESGMIGEVILRLEKKGVKPVAMKMVEIEPNKAKLFYSHLQNKIPQKVFGSIIKYMSSKRVVLIVWQGKGVVNKVREACGPTDPRASKKESDKKVVKR